MKDVIAEVKASVVAGVCEAKVKLEEDVANVGSWYQASWREALVKITSKTVNTSQDPNGKQQKVGEGKKVPDDDNQSMVQSY